MTFGFSDYRIRFYFVWLTVFPKSIYLESSCYGEFPAAKNFSGQILTGIRFCPNKNLAVSLSEAAADYFIVNLKHKLCHFAALLGQFQIFQIIQNRKVSYEMIEIKNPFVRTKQGFICQKECLLSS